jgi:hypothetical protein
MKTKWRWLLTLGLVLTEGFMGLGRSAAAGSPEVSSTITICVYNYANVDDKTLKEAKEVTAGIYRKVGVGIRWVDIDITSREKREKSVSQGSVILSRVQLNIFPREMMQHLDVPTNVLGLAPGGGTDRQWVYVFYNRVEALYQSELTARSERKIDLAATQPVILGHAIAHEIGHVLLNLHVHSAIGIMRGPWNPKDLSYAASGCLDFTPQQAESIRAEALRRNMRQEPLEGTKIEFPVVATSML